MSGHGVTNMRLPISPLRGTAEQQAALLRRIASGNVAADIAPPCATAPPAASPPGHVSAALALIGVTPAQTPVLDRPRTETRATPKLARARRRRDEMKAARAAARGLDGAAIAARVAANQAASNTRLVAALVDAPALGADVRALATTRADIAGVLTGTLCVASVDPPAVLAVSLPAAVEWAAGLAVLAKQVAISSGQDIALVRTRSAPPQFALVNRSVLAAEFGAVDARAFGAHFNDRVDPALITRVEARDRARAFAAERARQALAHEIALPEVSAVPSTVTDVGMISFLKDERDLAQLSSTLERWAESLVRFGRVHVKITVSDDSTPDLATELSARAAEISTRLGVDIEVLPRDARCARVAEAIDAVLDEPATGARLRAMGLPPQEARRLLQRTLIERGASQNRNVSMLLLEKPGLQVDHDMAPEAFMLRADLMKLDALVQLCAGDVVDEHLKARRAEQSPLRFRLLGGAPQPHDVLGRYEREPLGTVATPEFTGSNDDDAFSMMNGYKELSARSLGGVHHATTLTLAESAVASVLEAAPTGSSILRAPVFLPDVIPSKDGAPRSYSPAQPPFRDGDVSWTATLHAQGGAVTTLPVALHHQVPVGSRWGGEDRLLWDELLSRPGYFWLRDVVPQRVGDEQISSGVLGARIWTALGDEAPLKILDGLIAERARTYTRGAAVVVNALMQQAVRLDDMATMLEQGLHVSTCADLIYQWISDPSELADEATVSARFHDAKAAAADPERRRIIAAEMRAGDRQLVEAARAMAARFFLDARLVAAGGDAAVDQALPAVIAAVDPVVKDGLRAYALTLAIWADLETALAHASAGGGLPGPRARKGSTGNDDASNPTIAMKIPTR